MPTVPMSTVYPTAAGTGIEGEGAADRLQRGAMDSSVLHGRRQQQEEHRFR